MIADLHDRTVVVPASADGKPLVSNTDMSATSLSARLAFALGVAAAAASGACAPGPDVPRGAVIAGRIVDPQQLRPDGARLRVRHHGPFTETHEVVRPAADGSFATPRLPPGPYVLELVRTTQVGPADNVIGVRFVELAASDVRGVTIDVRRDTAVIGRFRMLTDDPRAQWPDYMTVAAYIAIDGRELLVPIYADGGPGATFVLRNAFGPRILRCYYRNAGGSRWWPLRVLLDGRDVTNVPVDFSGHPESRLEVVLTQHPARLTGTIVDRQGRPRRMAWITVAGDDPATRQAWATMADATQGDAAGRFSIELPPGTYRVRALPEETFPHLSATRAQMSRVYAGGVVVRLSERETQHLAVTLDDR